MRRDPQLEKAFCLPEAEGTLRMVERMCVYDKMIREKEPVSIVEATVNRATGWCCVSRRATAEGPCHRRSDRWCCQHRKTASP